MTAWQYFAGAGLVAALCPLHGHVAVAGDGQGDGYGSGYGARVDLCVPSGRPERPVFRPPSGLPSVRVAVPGADRPTVHHPGRPAQSATPAERPVRPAEPARPRPPDAAVEPSAEAGAGGSQPPEPAAGPEVRDEPASADAPAPPAAGAAAARVSAFHVRPYRSAALERRGPGGMSTVTLMVVVTTPAVLAAAALRPRSKSRG
ncbi:hypothetical protein Snoj_12320 [Streptomyces nojiriensis]|uniref:Uncharacterized protein n=1 Tax=Streptomyces nojiriensis TaxID=66374 RepID=A0ABQ3SGP5_9ACTN|nr:hypothetical protein [Streptomyces nojiriensis]QTI48945.1 hypothetical protein JYK04_06813 [Streptomyces nojiriensis]GGS08323.1 hypothetical protein GCM10010205_42140 [Streptomyces nojiriensis]GHI67314.1 hypothetical protein Snoj_12320 [Streptomyces nojiriensis]